MSKTAHKRLKRRIAKLEGALDAAQGKPARTNAPQSYARGYARVYQQGEIESARTVEF
jgi:hypothetical protein